MGKEKLWAIIKIQGRVQHQGLTLNEVRCFFMALPREDWEEWLVWAEGWSDWHSASSVAELHQQVAREFDLGQNPPYLDGLDDLSENDPQVQEMRKVLTSHRVKDSKSPSGPPLKVLQGSKKGPDVPVEGDQTEYVNRAHTRYDKRFRIEIECNGQRATSYSKNISVGGVMLSDPLPEWVIGYCKVDVYNEETNEMVSLTCSVVENQDPQARFRVEFLPLRSSKARRKLDAWLEAA